MKIEDLENLINSQPLDDFLGLSPNQMYKIFYFTLEELKDIIWFKSSFDQKLLDEVPVVKKTVKLLQLIGEKGEVKATEKGFLPMKMVNALIDKPFDNFTVQSEEYASEVLALRKVITSCGWIKKKSKKFSLTKKGEVILDKGFMISDYLTLLRYWLTKHNWAFTDLLPDCTVIQESSVFLLYMLNRLASERIPAERIFQSFIRAFPFVLDDLKSKSTNRHQTLDEELRHIFNTRFIVRVAEYFGLVHRYTDDKLSYFERDEKAEIKITKLFTEMLGFISPEKVIAFRKIDFNDKH
jgi:hypothetical protein